MLIFAKMKMTLLTMGKTDRDWVRQGLDIYLARLKHYVRFDVREIPELKKVSALDPAQIKVREGELILKCLQPSDELVLLDERGEMLSSVAFSRFIGERLNRSGHDLVFAVGGAYGFSDAVYDRANGRISLSRMTFSHQMVRAIFAEQLYRAFTILRGEPYHNE